MFHRHNNLTEQVYTNLTSTSQVFNNHSTTQWVSRGNRLRPYITNRKFTGNNRCNISKMLLHLYIRLNSHLEIYHISKGGPISLQQHQILYKEWLNQGIMTQLHTCQCTHNNSCTITVHTLSFRINAVCLVLRAAQIVILIHLVLHQG